MDYRDHERLESIRLRFMYQHMIEHDDVGWLIAQLVKVTEHDPLCDPKNESDNKDR